MFYMMFNFKPKKALVSSYITWASSKGNQAMANNFLKKKNIMRIWTITMIYCSHEYVWLDLSLCLYLLQKGTTRGTLLALEHMRTDKGGKGGVIINISSAAGIDAPNSLASFFFPLSIYHILRNVLLTSLRS